MEDRIYFCIDQRTFFATVECVARGLDPMTTKLVVADPERSVKNLFGHYTGDESIGYQESLPDQGHSP